MTHTDLVEMLAAPTSQPVDWQRVLKGPFFTFTGLRVPVTLRIKREESGGVVCTGLIIGWEDLSPRITARWLRTMPLGTLLASISDMATVGADVLDLVDAAEILPSNRPGRRGWPDEHWCNVANRYRVALVEAPSSPIKWLMADLHASSTTVHRWLVICRQRGLLSEDRQDRLSDP